MRRPFLKTTLVLVTTRTPRFHQRLLGCVERMVTTSCCATAFEVVVAAFEVVGRIVIPPKIAVNINSFFITSPFVVSFRVPIAHAPI
jgi:hypothetical protein